MRTTFLLLFALVCVTGTVQAREIFRCNGSIVETGLTIPEVIARCGEPESRDASAVPVRARSLYGASYIVGTASIEHWVYRRRGGQFPAYLTFDQGRLRRIELLYRH